MTKTKITSRIHQGAQSHQQEAFNQHLGGQRIFRTRENGKIANLVIGQVHVTDHLTMKERTKKVEAKVKTDHRTSTRDQLARIKKEIQDHIGGAAKEQVTKGGLLKLLKFKIIDWKLWIFIW